MARCGCGSVCNCAVTAGDGVTVTGVGTAANPYVVSSDSGNLEAVDSLTVDHTLTGDGSGADPYILSSDVILTPDGDVPEQAGNLIEFGPTGIYVSCEAVQDCVGEMVTALNDALRYDDAGNAMVAVVSGDADNAVVYGADGGLYAPAATGAETSVTAGDGVAVTGTGTGADPYVVAAVADPNPGNILTVGPDGILVRCEDVQDCVGQMAGQALVYSDNADPDAGDGVLDVQLSADAGNNIAIGLDGGLFVPAGAATVATDCGLTGDGAAATPLAVNAADPAAFPSGCDPAVDGAPIYCGADGALYSETWCVPGGLVATGGGFGAFNPPGNGTYTPGAQIGASWMNNECFPMRAIIRWRPSAVDGNVRDDNTTMSMDVLVGSAIDAAPVLNASQADRLQWSNQIAGGAAAARFNMQVSPAAREAVVVVPPGSTLNAAMQYRLTLAAGNGDISIANAMRLSIQPIGRDC